MTLEALGKLNNKKVSILGTNYTVKVVCADKNGDSQVSRVLAKQEASALTQVFLKEIWIDLNQYAYGEDCESQVMLEDNRAIDEDLTHELYHAFFYESGLDICTGTDGCENGWSRNEAMIDWNAKMFHKILKARRTLGIDDEF